MAVRCLIVDDNRAFLRAARNLLEGQGIVVVAAVTTGVEARRSCHELRPDVALVDIDLGTESGFDVADEIAGSEGRERPHVILISAAAESDFGAMIADSRATSFLSKAGLSGAAIRGILAQGRNCLGCRGR